MSRQVSRGGATKPWFLRGWRRPAHHPPHTFGRLGAFIGGVYAIVATLLVLELRVPEHLQSDPLHHQRARPRVR